MKFFLSLLVLMTMAVSAQEVSAPGVEKAAEKKVTAVKLDNLLVVSAIIGSCEVQKPTIDKPEAVIVGRAYPLGSVFRSKDAVMTVAFGEDAGMKVFEGTEFIVSAQPGKEDTRVIQVFSGKINMILPDDLEDDSLFTVILPEIVCKKLKGKSEMAFVSSTDTEIQLTIRGVTGRVYVEGTNYSIPQIRAANIVQVTNARDHSFTRITSLSGDYATELQNGTDSPTLFTVSPKALLKIWRKKAPVGERMLVSVLTVSPTGKAKNNFTYAIGRDEIKTGELIQQESTEEVAPAAKPAASVDKHAVAPAH